MALVIIANKQTSLSDYHSAIEGEEVLTCAMWWLILDANMNGLSDMQTEGKVLCLYVQVYV